MPWIIIPALISLFLLSYTAYHTYDLYVSLTRPQGPALDSPRQKRLEARRQKRKARLDQLRTKPRIQPILSFRSIFASLQATIEPNHPHASSPIAKRRTRHTLRKVLVKTKKWLNPIRTSTGWFSERLARRIVGTAQDNARQTVQLQAGSTTASSIQEEETAMAAPWYLAGLREYQLKHAASSLASQDKASEPTSTTSTVLTDKTPLAIAHTLAETSISTVTSLSAPEPYAAASSSPPQVHPEEPATTSLSTKSYAAASLPLQVHPEEPATTTSLSGLPVSPSSNTLNVDAFNEWAFTTSELVFISIFVFAVVILGMSLGAMIGHCLENRSPVNEITRRRRENNEVSQGRDTTEAAQVSWLNRMSVPPAPTVLVIHITAPPLSGAVITTQRRTAFGSLFGVGNQIMEFRLPPLVFSQPPSASANGSQSSQGTEEFSSNRAS